MKVTYFSVSYNSFFVRGVEGIGVLFLITLIVFVLLVLKNRRGLECLHSFQSFRSQLFLFLLCLRLNLMNFVLALNILESLERLFFCISCQFFLPNVFSHDELIVLRMLCGSKALCIALQGCLSQPLIFFFLVLRCGEFKLFLALTPA